MVGGFDARVGDKKIWKIINKLTYGNKDTWNALASGCPGISYESKHIHQGTQPKSVETAKSFFHLCIGFWRRL